MTSVLWLCLAAGCAVVVGLILLVLFAVNAALAKVERTIAEEDAKRVDAIREAEKAETRRQSEFKRQEAVRKMWKVGSGAPWEAVGEAANIEQKEGGYWPGTHFTVNWKDGECSRYAIFNVPTEMADGIGMGCQVRVTWEVVPMCRKCQHFGGRDG